MALWLARAGAHGEYESHFFDENRIYLTWEDLPDDLSAAGDYEAIRRVLQQIYPDNLPRQIGNYSGQVWAFVLGMNVGDWVVVPKKQKSTIAIGEIKSNYSYQNNIDPLYRHYREVRWLNMDIPRSAFDQDLLYSFGAFMTICQIQRNDAEKRVRAMALTNWTSAPEQITTLPTQQGLAPPALSEPFFDIEQLARDQIAKQIIQKFKGHGMAMLVEAVLKAKGFTTFRSPEGPDKGIDILAGSGPFGFDSPKICVQVKSGDTPADRPELTQLVGAMQTVNADQGLFVSWSDFKQTVYKEVPSQFFKVRLWNQNVLIKEIQDNYDKLDQDIRAELPLKQIWTLANPDE